MNRSWLTVGICLISGLCAAADVPGGPVAARPRGVAVGAAQATASAGVSTADATPAKESAAASVKYSTRDQWSLAGYNNNEVVYTIIVTNEDTRILHCTTLMSGWYIENGRKLSISDRQSTTVFPDQPTQVGNWMDMDQASGTTYSVKCRPI